MATPGQKGNKKLLPGFGIFQFKAAAKQVGKKSGDTFVFSTKGMAGQFNVCFVCFFVQKRQPPFPQNNKWINILKKWIRCKAPCAPWKNERPNLQALNVTGTQISIKKYSTPVRESQAIPCLQRQNVLTTSINNLSTTKKTFSWTEKPLFK